MACLEPMYNSSPHSQPPPTTMSPRISFSNDFVVEPQHNTTNNRASNPPSTDFEFSISNNDHLISTATADDLFFKGRLLPFKPTRTTTIKDQLLLNHDDEHDEFQFSIKPANKDSCSNKWKGFLGLRKSHITTPTSTSPAVKSLNSDGFSFANEDAHLDKSPKDVMSSGNPSNSDMEMGI